MSKSGTPMPKKAKASKISFALSITAMEDGTVNVTGHPLNLMAAMSILDAAKVAVVQQFIRFAQSDELDENYNFKQSKIIKATKLPLVGPGGNRMN